MQERAPVNGLEIRPRFRTDDRRWVIRGSTALIAGRDRLVYRGPLRSREILKGRRPFRVVSVRVRSRTGRRSVLWLLLVNEKRAVLVLNAKAWPEDGLEQLRRFLGVPFEVRDTEVSFRQLSSDFDGAVPWWARWI